MKSVHWFPCAYASYIEDSIKVRSVFSFHFHNIFSYYPLTDWVVVSRDSDLYVVPHKISCGGDKDNLNIQFFEDFFIALSSMMNGKYLGMDGFRYES